MLQYAPLSALITSKKLFATLTILFILPFQSPAQSEKLQGWHLKDASKEGVYGISLKQAYDFLAEKKIRASPVIVAILDDGIDTTHEDLSAVLWTNAREIAGNGIDDDGNGYADDVHGWNFLGAKDGRQVTSNSSEWIRVYWRYKSKYESKQVDTLKMQPAEKYEYAMWLKARSGVVGKGMKEEELRNLQTFLANATLCDSILKSHFPAGHFTKSQLEAYAPASQLETEVKKFFLEVFQQFPAPETTNSYVMEELQKYVTGEVRRASGDKVPPEDIRRSLTGDDDTNMAQLYYGNSDNTNGKLMHGTHLAGIIAANRKNNLGMIGIADNVQIMMVRTSAEGDEYDKDIASGIRYAVDNGARVINMSFGKSLSPDKAFIDSAVKYALSKDVLMVQAAGNSNRNIDGFDNFPNPRYLLTDSMAPNWITVGASDTAGKAATFSNYGKKVVDLFAPGVAIYSTIPGGNKYMSWDGTSMAAPVVTGVAAILRSYFPNFTAPEIKQLLLKSVSIPAATNTKADISKNLDELCVSGGIVNAAKAVRLAFETGGKLPD